MPSPPAQDTKVSDKCHLLHLTSSAKYNIIGAMSELPSKKKPTTPASGVFPLAPEAGEEQTPEKSPDHHREQLKAIERDVRTLVHNTRNPLTAMLYNIDTLEELLRTSGTELSPDVEETMTYIRRSLSHLQTTLSAPIIALEEALGRIPLQLEQIDVGKTVAKIAETYTGQADIHIRCLGDDTSALADREHFPQVLENIIQNAIKFNDQEKTTIEIAVIPLSRSVDIIVKDNGPGFQEDNPNRLLDEGARGNNTTDIEGSGLGLHYCKRVIEQIGGSISLQDNPIQRGGVVCIQLSGTYVRR